MTKLDEETIQKVIEASSNSEMDVDEVAELLKEAILVEGAFPRLPLQMRKSPEEKIPTIPDDPDLNNIKYVRLLRRSIGRRRPDPLVVAAIKAIMLKWGYKILSKVLIRVAKKMGFPLEQQEVEDILKKYGTIIVPFMAILLVDILDKYHKDSQNLTTELDIKS